MAATNHLQNLKKDLPPEIIDIVDTVIYTAGSYVDTSSESVLAKIVRYATMVWNFIKKFTSHPSKESQLALLDKYVKAVCPKKKIVTKSKAKNIEKYHKTLTTKRKSLEPQSYVTDIHSLTASIIGCKPKSKKFIDALDYFDYDMFLSEFEEEVPQEPEEPLPQEPIIIQSPLEEDSSLDESSSEDEEDEEEKPAEILIPDEPPKVEDVCDVIASAIEDDRSGVLECLRERIRSSKIVVVSMN